MGVYIKNMTMPKRCIDCPFMISRDDDDCILQSEEANESAKTWNDLKAKCPLKEMISNEEMATWIKCKNGSGYKCSSCGAREKRSAVFNHTHLFCYRCGKRMVGANQTED